MNQNRIKRRAARIGAVGQEYLLNVSKLRAVVRDYSRDRHPVYRVNPANRQRAQDALFKERRFWFGDRFSGPVSPAARAALRVACDVGTDFLSLRAALIPHYFARLLAARRMPAAPRAGVLAAAYENEGRN
ncbi:hypothetical protein [Achromobacter sp. UBA2119]|uniref:hypothetical protein n=1 Tax=Achromobacter sp. UBA2119 TaxID=1945911 RepID=UPI00257BC21E|nr:hypothetical protein [Achromobacter sp. UBA2119]